jgi:hypothetical protein
MSDIRFSGVEVYPHVRDEVDATMRRLCDDTADKIMIDFAEPLAELAAELGCVNAANDSAGGEFKPCTKYTLDEIATLANYTPTYSQVGRMAMVVAPDGTQYDFFLYPFAGGDAWVLIAVDGELPTMQPWCEVCSLPADICRGHDAPLSPSECFAQNVLQRVADEDCRYQLAMAQ